MNADCRSMTGFGRGRAERGHLRVAVELRGVNHRFADFSFKLPRVYSALQAAIQNRLQGVIQRGRLEVLVRREATGVAAKTVTVDEDIALAYAAAGERLAERLGRPGDGLSMVQLMAMPGVATISDAGVEPEDELDVVLEALDAALKALLSMRRSEGARLSTDVVDRLGRIETIVGEVEALAVAAPERIRERVTRRVQELLGDVQVDPARLLQEVAILADKAAIDEETTRLRSHVAQARELLALGEPVGRRLEFLVQEFQREINTIGSKAGDAEIATRVVALKSETEKIREQVANIE